MNARVLVVDDEPAILRAMQLALDANGFATVVAATGRQGVAKATSVPVDVMVLDLGLPDISGLEVVRQVRAVDPAIPIIILSAQDDFDTKVRALDLGADDFVGKPFNMPELLARVRVAVRRGSATSGGEPRAPSVIEHGGVSIDVDARRVRTAGGPVELTRTQFDVLAHLARHPHRVLTHRAISLAVWGPDHDVDPANLRVVVSNVRKAIDPPGARSLIRTVVGIGYAFEP